MKAELTNLQAKSTGTGSYAKSLETLNSLKSRAARGEKLTTDQQDDLYSAYSAIDELQTKLMELGVNARTVSPTLLRPNGAQGLVPEIESLAQKMLPSGVDPSTFARIPRDTLRLINPPNGHATMSYSPTGRTLTVRASENHGAPRQDGYGTQTARFSGRDIQLVYRKTAAELNIDPTSEFKFSSTNDPGNSYAFTYNIAVSPDPARTLQFVETFKRNFDSLGQAYNAGGAPALVGARRALAAGAPRSPNSWDW